MDRIVSLGEYGNFEELNRILDKMKKLQETIKSE